MCTIYGLESINPSEMKSLNIDPKFAHQIIKKPNLSEMTYEAIRNAITTGRIKPGERMMQHDIAQELNVSDRTVREAFARLVAKGLAVHEPYKGVRVTALPLEDLHEIYVIRSMLEGHAMELAAACITQADLDRMRILLPKTVANTEADSIQIAQEANKEFHWIPIYATQKTILVRILEQLWELMFAYNLIYENKPEVLKIKARNDFIQHSDMLAALEARDGARARQVTSDHINTTIQTLLNRLG